MSALEEKLLEHIRAAGLPLPIREYRFAAHLGRRYRADFFFAPSLLVECEGGSWVQGRHSGGTGFEADAEKYNLATILGFRTLRFTTNMIRDGRALATLEQALAPSPQAQVAARMETYPRVELGELAFREACTDAGITPIPAHPTGLTDSQAASVLRILPEGGRRIWPHEVGALDRLTDALVADTLAAPDADILAEFREDGGDPEQYAAQMRARFEQLAARINSEEEG